VEIQHFLDLGLQFQSQHWVVAEVVQIQFQMGWRVDVEVVGVEIVSVPSEELEPKDILVVAEQMVVVIITAVVVAVSAFLEPTAARLEH
jgi:hypothetical protein